MYTMCEGLQLFEKKFIKLCQAIYQTHIQMGLKQQIVQLRDFIYIFFFFHVQEMSH